MFKLRGCVSDCGLADGACEVPVCTSHGEGAILPSGDVLHGSGPALTSGVLVSFTANISTVKLSFNHSMGLRFANTSLCNISQAVGSGRVRRKCCAALPDTMKLCLGGAGAVNAPYQLWPTVAS